LVDRIVAKLAGLPLMVITGLNRVRLIALVAGGTVLAFSIAVSASVLSASNALEAESTITYAATVDVQRSTSLPVDSPSEILADVLASEGSPRILSASVGPAPPDFLENGYSGTWVYVVVDVPSVEGPGPIRAIWDAELAAGAFRDEMYRAGLIAPEGYGILVHHSDGSTRPYSAWPFGDIAYGQRFRAASTRATAEAELRDRLLTSGLKPTSIELIAARDLAAGVVAEITDPAASVDRAQLDQLIHSTFHNLHEYEGFYFEIDASGGKPLFILARSFRTGDGLAYSAPALGLEPLRGPLAQPK
jgi:hypothetical protein